MSDKRKHCRVDAKMPIGSRLLQREEAASAQSRIGTREAAAPEFPPPPFQDDPRLNEWLKLLHAKLSGLLALHAGEKKGTVEMKMRPVNVSAGGIMFPPDAAYKPGDKVEIHMELPMKKPVALVVIAEVLRVSPPLVSCSFINMEENVKQKLSEFVFFREREILMSERM